MYVSVNIWYCFSDLLHSVWQSLGSFTSLHMAQFRSSLRLSNSPLYIYNASSFIYSSVNGHLGCFHALVIVNSTATRIGVHISFWNMVFSGYMPRSGFAESIKAGEGVEKRGPSCTLGGNVTVGIGAAAMESSWTHSVEVPEKKKNLKKELPYDSEIPFLGMYPVVCLIWCK